MPKTDITPNHHPHEYEVISLNEDACGDVKIIYIGTFEQCRDRLNEIEAMNHEYANRCQVRKVR